MIHDYFHSFSSNKQGGVSSFHFKTDKIKRDIPGE